MQGGEDIHKSMFGHLNTDLGSVLKHGIANLSVSKVHGLVQLAECHKTSKTANEGSLTSTLTLHPSLVLLVEQVSRWLQGSSSIMLNDMTVNQIQIQMQTAL